MEMDNLRTPTEHLNRGSTYIGEGGDDWDEHSITKRYYRMKAEDSRYHLENLPSQDTEKLKTDERRIKRTKARLRRQRDKSKLLEAVSTSRQDWRTSRQDWRKDPTTASTANPVYKPDLTTDTDSLSGTNDDPAYEMKAGFMFFEKHGHTWKGATYHGQNFPTHEEFPNQKLSVHDALYNDENNPFLPQTDKETQYLRYIHLPANHMVWIEQAMARYHDEDKVRDPEFRPKTKKTLSREHWRGQLHGSGLGRNPIHATHMRSRCSVVPRGTQSMVGLQKSASQEIPNGTTPQERSNALPKDFAIFLPYLHWETSGRRARMAETVQTVLKEWKAKQKKPKAPTQPPAAKATRQKSTEAAGKSHSKAGQWFMSADRRTEKAKEDAGKKTRTKLAQYLLNVAHLWEAMDTELDQRLLRHGLITSITRDSKGKISEPALHVRRTLDQSYFLNMDDTSERDQDQVVYRATKRPWSQGLGNLTRVVMVDQLWLWILDGHTIITSFSKRWGINKPDASGIHKSLRQRLAGTDMNIMSVYHLASIIIDQCSSVFFDRTKPLDMRPEVMDIFAESLGEVNDYAAIASKVFWEAIGPFHKSREKQSPRSYLSINLEGRLLHEAQDISEELRIMMSIYSQQLNAVSEFRKRLQQLKRSHMHEARSRYHRVQSEGRRHDVDDQMISSKEQELNYLDDLLQEVSERKGEMEDLEAAAQRTCKQLEALLSLKQQQASIEEAKDALDRADETIDQGKAIVAFTIMTVIFTPLGFFTSFFGMNNSATGTEWMSLGRQCVYMFCLSTFIIIAVLVLAFNKKLRRPISSVRDYWKHGVEDNVISDSVIKPKKNVVNSGKRATTSVADALGNGSSHLTPGGRTQRRRRARDVPPDFGNGLGHDVYSEV